MRGIVRSQATAQQFTSNDLTTATGATLPCANNSCQFTHLQVDAANETYRRAEIRIRRLQPPPSLQKLHAEYLDAVGLYKQSAAEMVRVFKDGRDEHLVAAFPMSKEAGEKILRVGNTLWPGEYVPN